jgi:hypothetical protein
MAVAGGLATVLPQKGETIAPVTAGIGRPSRMANTSRPGSNETLRLLIEKEAVLMKL